MLSIVSGDIWRKAPPRLLESGSKMTKLRQSMKRVERWGQFLWGNNVQECVSLGPYWVYWAGVR
jgi:hypothetical protein